MKKYIIGTTPTIVYTFSEVDPTEITEAVVTFVRNSTIVLQKELVDAVVGTNTLTWTLTQEETLALGTGKCEVMINYLYDGGTKRGASRKVTLVGVDNHIDEVMT